MRRALLGLGLLLATMAVVATILISLQAERLHGELMDNVARTGLARDLQPQFERGWLSSQNQGQLALANSLCGACEQLNYRGELRHGLGVLLAGQIGLASADYQISLPQWPVTPALPDWQLSALFGLDQRLLATLAAPASQHEWRTENHRYAAQQQGIDGQFDGRELALQAPRIALARDDQPWLVLESATLQARADPAVSLLGQIATLSVPGWDWQTRELQLDYRQAELGRRLSFDLSAQTPGGQIADRAHASSAAALKVERLDLDASRAFLAEMPRLLDPATSRTARLFGLLSLYSLHGPALFGAAPRIEFNASALPLPEGPAEIELLVQVKSGLARPPMQPQQWLEALDAVIDVHAPPQRLAAWWQAAAGAIHYITGLPSHYAQLRSQGWVITDPQGRDHLRIELRQGQLRSHPAAE